MHPDLKASFQKPQLYIAVIILGVLLKFYGLDSKFKWLDEVFTMSHTSGIDMREFVYNMPDDTLYMVEDFNQILDMNSGVHTLGGQLSGLSKMVQVTPLHYFFLVFWHRLVGSDVIHYRLFSLLVFLLCIPLLYALMRELTNSRTTGLVAASLFSVAPFFHFYAQEARYYALWGLAIILVNLLLLKALRYNNAKWWVLYSLSAVMAMYVCALSGLVLVGHLVFVIAFHRTRWMPIVIAGTAIFLSYLPWIISMYGGSSAIMDSTSWQFIDTPVWKIIAGPLYSMANAFITAPTDSGNWAAFSVWPNHSHVIIAIQTAVIVLIGLLGIFGMRQLSRRALWFNFLGIMGFLIIFWAFDLFSGRTLSLVYRYHIPIILASIVFTALLLGKHIEQNRTLHTLMFVGLIVLSTFSCYQISRDPCYYNMGNCNPQLKAAEVVSAEERPLVICGTDIWALAYIFWEFTLATNSNTIEILRNPDPDNLAKFLNAKSYSGIYTYSLSSRAKYALLEYYQTHPARQPLAVNLLDASEPFFCDRVVDIEEATIDTTLDLTPQMITIELQTDPEFTTDNVYISGSHYTLGSWDPAQVPMQLVSPGLWTGTFPIQCAEGSISYTFTLGNWMHHTVDSLDNPVPEFVHEIQGDTMINVKIWRWKGVDEI